MCENGGYPPIFSTYFQSNREYHDDKKSNFGVRMGTFFKDKATWDGKAAWYGTSLFLFECLVEISTAH